MNALDYDILSNLITNPYSNQRIIAETLGYSLGKINNSLKILIDKGYLTSEFSLTPKCYNELNEKKPKNAVILAAGFGTRMIPLNASVHKAFLEVDGEPIIERQIRFLHEAGISEIYVVAGHLKENFEYLIDKFNIKLLINKEYMLKNNFHSLYLVKDKLFNSYVIPCDIYFTKNPFSKYELYSWYMVNELLDNESTVRVNRKRELVMTDGVSGGNSMIGLSYLLEKEADIVKQHLSDYSASSLNNSKFWEEALFKNKRMITFAKIVKSSEAIEINTIEQLRDIDEGSNALKSNVIKLISDFFKVSDKDIVGITALKKGMTNRSFIFVCNNKKYIMRMPGEGTENLINRFNEYSVYEKIKDKNVCDKIVYISPENGFKITEYIDDARVCDPYNKKDVALCMKFLREFHEMQLEVNHEFNIFEEIEKYERLRNKNSCYSDYDTVKANVLSLRKYIESQPVSYVLTHIDSVPDNFLFTESGIKLIDWEYSGMQDAHVDIAMFAIYSMYERAETDELISLYFTEGCTKAVRLKIYCYIAMCGLLWSNWCEYKQTLGVEFGEYSIKQFRYAKEYFRYFTHEKDKAE